MSEDRSYVEENTRERERLRALVGRLDEDELRTPVNPHWTVAGVFGHIAFWDSRGLLIVVGAAGSIRCIRLMERVSSAVAAPPFAVTSRF